MIVTPINVSTTFRYPKEPELLHAIADLPEDYIEEDFVYSREGHPNSVRIEAVFEKILGGPSVIYSGGLAAFNGIMTHFNPKQVAVGPCYHGVRMILDIHTRNFGLKQLSYSEEDLDKLQPGDLVHIETPVNPEGLSKDIKWFAEKAHAKGALLSVDSTFAPPPLQDPFKFGADIIMHSATKYFGGHSDLLAGVLCVKDLATKRRLVDDRMYLGTNIANLEAYLLLRSLRSYDLRIKRQSENALKVVTFLRDNKHRFKVLKELHHSSLQTEPFVKEQLPNGYGPVFAFNVDTKETAKILPSRLKIFHHATSLGGLESLIEWRALSDSHVDQTLLRISVGGFSTKLIHADDSKSRVPDIVTPINVSTTFRYPKEPELLHAVADLPDGYPEDDYVYSRLNHPNAVRIEEVFEQILGGPSVIYSSGLAVFNAIMTHFNPKQVAVGPCYHGVRKILDIHTRNFGLKQLSYSEEDLDKLQPGDIVHIETPVNPEGYSKDIKWFAEKAHAKGALLSVDSTFAPPPLQDPFKFGADIIMHSATKYFGGHSDLLAGVLCVKDRAIKKQLIDDRMYLGTNIANLEAYLLLRSLRSYDLRIKRQSENALKVVTFLRDNKHRFKVLKELHHSSLQTEPFVKEQLPNGYGPVFALNVDSKETAKNLPSRLKLFHHATSLGGLESLIEWRAVTDPYVDQTLIRVSIGGEDPDDLIADLESAFLSFN
ncbi:Cystathionine gamma-lyase [Cyberlindnera fabianii]|uniref:Cystathionine gamma-lyase n=1 Tax=Cyberlindnera fabianii TaxID=36022 RepID=A0A1V2L260_CYBFA|nr:Cystathionine gamma-lyase [Cyberlindnera fabianii]